MALVWAGASILGGGGTAADRSSDGPAATTPSKVLVLAVRVEPEPMMALVGAMGGRPPVVVDVPSRLVLTLPSATVADAATGDDALLLSSVSNLLGVPVDHALALDAEGLVAIVDRTGGLDVALPAAAVIGHERFGSGRASLAGKQVAAYLGAKHARDRDQRWRAVLTAFMAAGPEVRSSDVAETDDVDASLELLREASGASLVGFPVRTSEGGLLAPRDPGIRDLLAKRFGIDAPVPVPVIVLNGSGVPGVGSAIASKLVPEGFRVVSAQNAPRFDHDQTVVYASRHAALADARRIGKLLGVSRVTLGGAAGGVADITILVGRDFQSA